MMTIEQFAALQKSQADTAFEIAGRVFDGAEKWIALNVEAARTALVEAAEGSRTVYAVKDPQEFFAVQAGMMLPAAERLAGYGRRAAEIAMGTQAELVGVVEAQVAGAQHRAVATLDGATKSAPPGTESAVAWMRSAIAAASGAYDGMQRATKQAADVAEANFQAMTGTTSRVAQTASRSTRRASAAA